MQSSPQNPVFCCLWCGSVSLLVELETGQLTQLQGHARQLSCLCSVVDQQGVTALCVTHRLEELRYADSASFMDGGCIQISGSPDSIAAHMRKLGARAY